jgi:hypothetical protein
VVRVALAGFCSAFPAADDLELQQIKAPPVTLC